MNPITKAIKYLALSLALALPAMAADLPSEVTLFKTVNIFDGENEKLLEGYDVLVVRNLIKQVAGKGKVLKTSLKRDSEDALRQALDIREIRESGRIAVNTTETNDIRKEQTL